MDSSAFGFRRHQMVFFLRRVLQHHRPAFVRLIADAEKSDLGLD
jgi:hypothetical protein